MFFASCGDGGIISSGPLASLTETTACLEVTDPDPEADAPMCYRIESSSEIEAGLVPGDLVTLKASDEVIVELKKVPPPE